MRRLEIPPSLALVLLYELLVSNRLNKRSGKLARSVAKNAELIKTHAQSIAETLPMEETQRMEQERLFPRYARINTLRISKQHCLKKLRKLGFEVMPLESASVSPTEYRRLVGSLKNPQIYIDPHIADLLIFPAGTQLHEHPMVVSGKLILQDKASCLPVQVLNPEQNAHVIDACAAPGMKTSHAAAIQENTGRIWSFDSCPQRAQLLQKMLDKFGVENAEVKCLDFLKLDVSDEIFAQLQVVDRLDIKVEYAIVDPPCTGSGMVKREEYLADPSTVAEEQRRNRLSNLQSMILKHTLRLPKLKRLVYSTCSLSEEENEGVIQEALADRRISEAFELVDAFPEWRHRGSKAYTFGNLCLRADFNEDLANGFFVALFQRKN